MRKESFKECDENFNCAVVATGERNITMDRTLYMLKYLLLFPPPTVLAPAPTQDPTIMCTYLPRIIQIIISNSR